MIGGTGALIGKSRDVGMEELPEMLATHGFLVHRLIGLTGRRSPRRFDLSGARPVGLRLFPRQSLPCTKAGRSQSRGVIRRLRTSRCSVDNVDEFKGKVVLITGGGKGVGRGISERFLERGAEVLICGREAPPT